MKQEIEIEGLPEGWRAIAFRSPRDKEYCWMPDWEEIDICHGEFTILKCFILEKIQPRRIVLEETGKMKDPQSDNESGYVVIHADDLNNTDFMSLKLWKVVE